MIFVALAVLLRMDTTSSGLGSGLVELADKFPVMLIMETSTISPGLGSGFVILTEVLELDGKII